MKNLTPLKNKAINLARIKDGSTPELALAQKMQEEEKDKSLTDALPELSLAQK